MYENSLFWFRRDHRLQDNNALNHCLTNSKNVYPVFIFTPIQVSDKNKFKSDKSVQFMIQSLKDLDNELNKKDSSLQTFYGENESIIEDLIKKNNIDCLYFNADYTPYSKNRDVKIQSLCKKLGIHCKCFHDVCLIAPGKIKTSSGYVYQKFTPFYEKYLDETIKSPKTVHKKNFASSMKYNDFYKFDIYAQSQKIVLFDDHSLLKGGRNEAKKKLALLKNMNDYNDTRNNLDVKTTQLSAYLKYGCVSPREVYDKVKGLFGEKDAIIRQLIWRDFYIHILDAFPRVLMGKSLKPKYDSIKWLNSRKFFNTWKSGKTGFPIVDANMRMLNKVGYMHNRGRLIVASFLIKTLLIDWRWGEKYFAQKLIDYDPAANNGNWQWVAGSGADSQPYFRIFNPWSQSEKHDKDASFIKKWIPELENVEPKHIHNWNDYYSMYSAIDYNKPIVDYKLMREEALKMYKIALS